MEQMTFLFDIEGTPLSCQPYGMGHLNRTFRIDTDRGRKYILQRVNSVAFHDIPGLMDNVVRVTAELAQHNDDPRSYLHLIPTHQGDYWVRDAEGEYWRMYEFIEDSLCLQEPETPADLYQSAVGFGRFQRYLQNFPIDTLCETIPDFHNTPVRFQQFREALEKDAAGRAASVKKEIEFFLAREKEGSTLQIMRDKGQLPVRVTHNDTKLNNVLLDASTRKALCVIDLDTVMPGLVAYDFGDAIRFGASTGAEDEKDLSKIEMDMTLFETFTNGFVPECGGLTDLEIETLPLGALIMTLENGIRFLADYLNGDVYYSIDRPEHNLDRARTQLRLVEDMEKKRSAMDAVIRKYR